MSARDVDLGIAYIVRAVILGLLFWFGITLVNLDKNVAVIQQRLTQLEAHHRYEP